ncbi:uncharacterized protein LOC106873591 [Octopus bimaculoides]|uniref:uncharacterized protein LOC106873591 n=1 Tax=Octopus bimaculoides TaxID=37653 RepID=UPI0022E58AA7|nr:uncharacterized protein LOC106873591 [Octopus bimaculoides]
MDKLMTSFHQGTAPFNATFQVRVYNSLRMSGTVSLLRTTKFLPVDRGEASEVFTKATQYSTKEDTQRSYIEELGTNFMEYKKDDFKIGPVDVQLSKSFKELKEIKLSPSDLVDGSEIGFIDSIAIDKFTENESEIGIDRWLWSESRYPITVYPVMLKADPHKAERIKEMQKYRDLYKLKYVEGFPLKVSIYLVL